MKFCGQESIGYRSALEGDTKRIVLFVDWLLTVVVRLPERGQRLQGLVLKPTEAFHFRPKLGL